MPDESRLDVFTRNLVPSEMCLLCGATLDEIGGKRIAAQQFQGVTLSAKFTGGGNAKHPYQSIKLDEESEIWVTVWGEKTRWTEAILLKARDEYAGGYRPWFCQRCGYLTCSICDSPVSLAMGSDILHDDGSIKHQAIFPCHPSCTNPDCENYRKPG